MAFITESYTVDVISILVALFICLYAYCYWSFKYWERKGIPFVKPTFPIGNLNIFSNPPKSIGELLKINYDIFKSQGHKHLGIFFFARPIYVPLDLEYIKNILSVDFDHFVDRGFYHDEKDDPLSENLIRMEGQKWKNLRTKVTPAFTLSKIKAMFQIVVRCGTDLKEAMDILCSEQKPVGIKNILARFTMNVIGSCAFGIDCNCLKDPNSDFRKYGARFFDMTILETFESFVGMTAPDIARALKFKSTPLEVTNFFLKVVEDTVKYRKANNTTRKDFLQLLLEIKDTEKSNNKISEELTIQELAAQVFIFFAAGYETSSTTMTFCLFELTQHLEIQQRVRDEINEVLIKHNGEITYEALNEMKYMNQVIDETLRKHPPLNFLNRICVKDYRIPGTNLQIDKDTLVLIPVFGLHRDPEYFPGPERFDPDRFNEENRSSILPYTYLPFGEGPRNCLGIRFGIVEVKMGLTVLLKNFKFTLNEKTSVPLIMDPLTFVYTAKGDVWVNVEKAI